MSKPIAPVAPAPIQSFEPEPPIDINKVLDARVDLTPPEVVIKDKPVTVVVPLEDDAPEDIKLFKPSAPPKEGEEPDNLDDPAPRKKESSKMREEMQKVLKQKAEIEKLAEERNNSLTTLQAELERTKADYEAKAKEELELKKKIAIGDPYQHPEMREIEAPWLSKRNEIMSEVEMTGQDPSKFNSWTFQAITRLKAAGAPGTPEYRQAIAELRQGYLQEFPEAEDYLMPALTLVKDGVSTSRKQDQFVTELNEQLPAVQFRQYQKQYEAAVSEYERDERVAFNPDEDIKMNDPLNTRVILRAMIDGSPEVQKAAEAAKAVVRSVMLPIRPVNPESLNGMDDGKKMEILQQHTARHRDGYLKLRSMMPEAIVALQVLPALFKRLTEAEDKLKLIGKEPSPSLRDEHGQFISREAPDVRDFKPTNPEMDKVTGRR